MRLVLVPTVTLRPTVPSNLHEFVPWAPSIVYIDLLYGFSLRYGHLKIASVS